MSIEWSDITYTFFYRRHFVNFLVTEIHHRRLLLWGSHICSDFLKKNFVKLLTITTT